MDKYVYVRLSEVLLDFADWANQKYNTTMAMLR